MGRAGALRQSLGERLPGVHLAGSGIRTRRSDRARMAGAAAKPAIC